MIYTVQNGDTAISIAATYTVGGSAYGPALMRYNGIMDPNNETAYFPDDQPLDVGITINIPDSWLLASYPTGAAALSGVASSIQPAAAAAPAAPAVSSSLITLGIVGIGLALWYL